MIHQGKITGALLTMVILFSSAIRNYIGKGLGNPPCASKLTDVPPEAASAYAIGGWAGL